MSLRNITLTTALTFNVPEIIDITDELPKNQSWDTLKGKKNIVRGVWDGTYHTGLRNAEDITTIVIHHAPPDAKLEVHARNHAKAWGAGIAYHIAIDEGRIKQMNDLLSFTFHCGGNNTYTVGIVVNADLSKREMTSQERELLYAAILTVKSILPIQSIVGHNEVQGNVTACPCTSMNRIREDIQTLEMKMKQESTWAAKLERVKSIVNQINYMNDLIRKGPDDGEAHWAVNEQLKLYDLMKQQKLL